MAELFVAGTGFETDSEQATAALLEQLPKSWLVVANKFLVRGHGQTFEIDFIVIGDHRIMVLDDKYWRGKITGTAETWTLHRTGESRRSPFHQVERNQRQLLDFLRGKGVSIPYATIQPIIGALVMTHPDSSVHISDPRAKHCLMNRENLLEKLRWLDDEGARAGFDLAPLRPSLRKAIVESDDRQRPVIPKNIQFFKIQERLEVREHCQVFAATHQDDQSRRTLYVYGDLDNSTGQRLDHELAALRSLQQTGVVPVIDSSFPWGDDGAIVVPVRPLPGIAWGALPQIDSEPLARRRLREAAAAFSSLAALHDAKVLHRRLNPATVMVEHTRSGSTGDDMPHVGFSDFVFARVEGGVTIAPTLDALGFDDPYASPSINQMESYGFADRSSDVYSLALVVLESLLGMKATDIADAIAETRELPVEVGQWPYFPDDVIPQLNQVFTAALTGGSYYGAHELPAREVAGALQDIAATLDERDKPKPKPTPASSPYKVVRMLGKGAFAQTFLVEHKDTGTLVAAKQYTRRDILDQERERIVAEFKTLWSHPHPNLPRPFGAAAPDAEDFQLVMEYIPGETLQAKLPDIAQDRDAWANVMRGVLAAVEHLELHGILHRDIKPDNIMIRDDDGRVFLIDYSAATTRGPSVSLAGAPAYWPPEWREQQTLPPGADRYAAAMTLLIALTGQTALQEYPGSHDGAGNLTLPDDLPPALQAVGRALLQALSPDPDQRPATTELLRNTLEQALMMVEPPPVDPLPPAPTLLEWTANLRRLFRNSRAGNADNRGLDSDFARDTYVETELDLALWPAIQHHHPAVVFLSGNPGDGKTAFLEHVRELIVQAGGTTVNDAPENDPSGWELELHGHTYRACFDASESVRNRSATEQVVHRLRGLTGEPAGSNTTVLIAINDGRLAELRRDLEESHHWLIDGIAAAKIAKSATELRSLPVWVIDLKHRAYIALSPDPRRPSIMRQMLGAMVEERHWPGAGAVAHGYPPAANAIALRETSLQSPADRLEFLFTLAHLRGDRHTTIRDLRSALALLVTADIDPAGWGTDGPTPQSIPWQERYWNIAFTTDASRDLVLGDLRWLDPARFAHPELERFLYFHHRPEDAPLRKRLFANGIDEPPPAGDQPELLREWIGAVKRRLYFEGAVDAPDSPVPLNPRSLIPYAMAEPMMAFLRGDADGEELKATILRGISRSDAFVASLDATGLMLTVKTAPEHQLEMVKTLPAEEFTLEAGGRAQSSILPLTPRTITLRHTVTDASVRLNIDLIEVLGSLDRGLAPRLPELRPLLEELTPFKSTLQRSRSDQLLLIEGGRRHLLIKQGERIIRRDA
ncbi:MAG: NERD domain-containing protein [Thermomicrobiales bacterium]